MSYGLLGEKLTHSYSPRLHAIFADYEYRLYQVAPENLEDFIKNGDWQGLNVTIPYKKTVLPYLADMSDRARKIGSVNVILKQADGTLYGDNTDYGGFAALVRRSGIAVRGKKVLVLGSGGASLTVCRVLEDMAAGEIRVISRSGEDNYGNLPLCHADADVIVNTTPVGMYPNAGASPVDLRIFPHLSGVIDIIYNPAKTALMLQAQRLGIPFAGGLYMLCEQAREAAEMFLGKKIPQRMTDKAFATLNSEMRNIVLIGMPGCGKTVIGKRIAALCGREFFDIDKEIEKKAGKSIPDIFASDGEEAFRLLETECCAEICSGTARVIATGGGVVTRERNRDILRQNSVVVYISRDLSRLATGGRPLSQAHSAGELYSERAPMYKEWSDIKIVNSGISPTAFQLLNILGIKPNRSKKGGKVK